MISILAVITPNDVVSVNEHIPEIIPEHLDLIRSKDIIIMGANTYNLIGPLGNRTNLVLSRKNGDLQTPNEILRYCRRKEACVIGGCAAFSSYLTLASKLIFFRIPYVKKGTYFPTYRNKFKLSSRKEGIYYDKEIWQLDTTNG